MRAVHRFATVIAALGLALPGCLPGDTRPEPGSVLVTTAPSTGTTAGFTTSDHWTISLDRLLAGVGAVQLGGSGCVDYAEPRYTRLFDFAVPFSEPQKVAIVYGRGACDVGFELSAPESDALLGVGATSADLDLMRLEASDPFVDEPERTSVLVAGVASRDGVTKRFEWRFRMEYDIERCEATQEGPGTVFRISGGDAHELTIVVDVRELFHARPERDAPEVFEPFAAADADGDDFVTLEELAKAHALDEDGEVPDGTSPPAPGESLADLLYEELVPRMARPPGRGECEVELDDR